jgi:apolipoprotein N-acyltransferase
LICYEDMIERNVRQTAAGGAEALFSLIQGSAFENPLTLIQHQRLAALRAVENRRYFVRCSSTGVTCVIAPTGQIVAQLPPQSDGTLLSEIALIRGRTPYNLAGDLFPAICTILVAIGLVRCRRDKSRG